MPDSRASLLLADRDAQYRRELRASLEVAGLRVREADDAWGLLDELRLEIPHLVVVDLQIHPLGGLQLCGRIQRYADVPIVVLTALEDEETKLAALDLYAEDYIVKPARCAEVVVRVKRIIRRTWLSSLPANTALRIDDQLSLDFFRRESRTPQQASRLTPLESRLLQVLVRNAGQVLPTSFLLERLWGEGRGAAGSLWEYVRRLRRKIGDDAANPRYILNEPGLGYRFSGLFSDVTYRARVVSAEPAPAEPVDGGAALADLRRRLEASRR